MEAARPSLRPPAWTALAVAGLTVLAFASPARADSPAETYKSGIQPLLDNYCYDCHGDGSKKGKVSLDQFASEEAMLHDHVLW